MLRRVDHTDTAPLKVEQINLCNTCATFPCIALCSHRWGVAWVVAGDLVDEPQAWHHWQIQSMHRCGRSCPWPSAVHHSCGGQCLRCAALVLDHHACDRPGRDIVRLSIQRSCAARRASSGTCYSLPALTRALCYDLRDRAHHLLHAEPPRALVQRGGEQVRVEEALPAVAAIVAPLGLQGLVRFAW